MKKNSKAFIMILIILLIGLMAFLVKRKSAKPNLYLENSGVLVNFDPAFSGTGTAYDRLEEIEAAPEDIISIEITNVVINDGQVLSEYEDLECLIMDRTEINDFSFIKNLKSLKRLEIYSCSSDSFDDIKYLPNKENLLYFSLANSQYGDSSLISNIDFLEGFTGIIDLNLGGNDIRSIEPISGMENLEQLMLWDNFNLESLEPLYDLGNLTQVIIPPTYVFSEDDIAHLGDPYDYGTIYYD